MYLKKRSQEIPPRQRCCDDVGRLARDDEAFHVATNPIDRESNQPGRHHGIVLCKKANPKREPRRRFETDEDETKFGTVSMSTGKEL
jgi:hypothetical protein